MGNFRRFITSSGREVLAGKDRETNEELIGQVEKDNWILHTEEKGSPFAEIKNSPGILDAQKSRISDIKEEEKNVNKKDIKEAAIFIAKFSQDWKKNKRDVIVHYFKGKDIFKSKGMPIGTFGVRKYKEIKLKKEEIKKLEND